MTASEVPQWLQTAHEKRFAREKAIDKFLDAHKTRFEVLFLPLSNIQTDD